jgi:excisionase family DNA binding protein
MRGVDKMMSSDPSINKVNLFLTVGQVADELGVSTKHIRRAIAGGELPFHRFGRAVRIARQDLEHYVRRHRE